MLFESMKERKHVYTACYSIPSTYVRLKFKGMLRTHGTSSDTGIEGNALLPAPLAVAASSSIPRFASLEISKELDQQNKMLENVNTDFEEAIGGLDAVTRKTKELIKKSGEKEGASCRTEINLDRRHESWEPGADD